MTDKDKLSKIIEIIATKNGVADSQEFGLSYSQAINYLEEIEDVVRETTVKQQVLEIIQDEIEGIKHNFPFTHDDEVKLDKLIDVYDLIDSTVKE